MRGFCGIGIYYPEKEENVGTLWRSAQAFGARFIFTVGNPYKFQASDTSKARRHIPLFHYADFHDLKNHLPADSHLVCIENKEDAFPLDRFSHPERAVYLLGSEGKGLPPEVWWGRPTIKIASDYCLNVAVAGSIVLWDRMVRG